MRVVRVLTIPYNCIITILLVDVSNLHMVAVMVTKTTFKLYITVYINVVSVLALLDLTASKCYFIKKLYVILIKTFVTTGVKCKNGVKVIQCLDNPCDTI